MTNQVQIYTAASAAIVGAAAVTVGVPFLVLAAAGGALCYGMHVTNQEADKANAEADKEA